MKQYNYWKLLANNLLIYTNPIEKSLLECIIITTVFKVIYII